MAGQGAKRRQNIRRAQAKKQNKKAAKQEGQAQRENPQVRLALPVITEDDLLAFQSSHFGDDTKPLAWVVAAEIALEYDPAWEDDGLGFYDDGVKRTLTDEQIAMFRHSEIEALVREGTMTRSEIEGLAQDVTRHAIETQRADYSTSGASSLEADLVDVERFSELTPTPKEETKQRSKGSNAQIEATRPPYDSDGSNIVKSNDPIKRKRDQEVPYYERHKRKWESYIQETDPSEGSMTYRRLARELDEVQDDSIDLEY